MDYPYLNLLELKKEKAAPVYLQIAQGLSALIKQGILKPGQKLPGSRVLAAKLQVNRNTLTLATDELQAEGWLVAKSKSGLFVNEQLPLITLQQEDGATAAYATTTGFTLHTNPMLEAPEVHHYPLEFNDGFPDLRLSPLTELGRAYRSLLPKAGSRQLLTYSNAQGDLFFREQLSRQLNEVRGFNISPADIMVTRGSIMGIHLVAKCLLQPGDVVVVGELSYRTANLCFEQCGARLLRIPVDEKGIDTAALEQLLENEKVRLLYITSHHHHPTTVSLAPERRLQLYELARKYQFCILEDDYDFDYHYENKPTLPIASMDKRGLVVYTGSYSKSVCPGIRMGFVVAPQSLIGEMIKYRRIVDRQGDHLMERALGLLLQDGTIQRFLRKSKKIYKKRKEYFCQLLRQEFCNYLHFQEPDGGMAVWVRFKDRFRLPEIAARCREKGLYLSDGAAYQLHGKQHNCCRMGFAALNEKEIREACTILKEVLQQLERGRPGV